MGKILFNIGQGGLGRPLPGKDYYSGLLFDSDFYPSGFSALEPIKVIGSLAEAENLGINNSGSDETIATGGSVQITGVGVAGDTWIIKIKSTRNPEIVLATVIENSTETPETLAAKIAAAINAETTRHKFTAAVVTDTVNLTMAPNWGEAFNTAGLSATSTGTGTAVVTQFDGGIGSDNSLLYYQISEFFRIQPQGLLWVGIYDESGGLDGQHIKDIQDESGGDIRQMGILLKTDFSTSDLAIIQEAIEELQTEYKFLNAIYSADQLGDSLSGLDDLRTLNYDRVSAVLAQDGGAEGWRLVDVLGRSVSAIGATLGAVSFAAVSDNIGWVSKFNLSGVELDTLSFTTGDLVKGTSRATLDLLTNKGWIYLKKLTGKAGSYFDDSPTAVIATSDYAYIENGRTIDKAIRGVNASLSDYINSPLYVDPDTGYMTELTAANMKNAAAVNLEQMLKDQELSGYQVIINPEQDVLTTSRVEITIKLVPVGVAREIVVNIGYTVNL